MYLSLKRLSLVTWIAMLGVLFAALAPAMSHAVALSAPGDRAVQMCTSKGLVSVVPDPSDPATSSQHAPEHLVKQCPFCTSHHPCLALPPVAAFTFPVLVQAGTYPALFYRSAAPLFAWTVANPRAPPLRTVAFH